GDGMPHFVEIRDNRIHDNPQTGFTYYGIGCDDSANDNSFHDNLVYGNGTLALILSALRNDDARVRLVLKDNVFSGLPYQSGSALALLVNTSLDAATSDGNTFFVPGADAATPLFRWRCSGCGRPRDGETKSRDDEVPYSFDQLSKAGIAQDNTRRPDLHC